MQYTTLNCTALYCVQFSVVQYTALHWTMYIALYCTVLPCTVRSHALWHGARRYSKLSAVGSICIKGLLPYRGVGTVYRIGSVLKGCNCIKRLGLFQRLCLLYPGVVNVLRNCYCIEGYYCIKGLLLFKGTRRYGLLRGPTSSSCGGLWPSAEAFFALRARKELFWPIFGIFWCPVVTLVTFSSNLSNFKRNPKKTREKN